MRIALTVFAVMLGCSSTEPSSTNPADTGAGDAAADVELVGFKCGAAPYYKWSGVVEMRDGAGTKPAVGAKLVSDACPGQTLVIGADGKFDLLLPRGLRSFARIENPGALNTMLGEWAVESDQGDIGLVLLPNIFAALIPDWDPSTESAVVLRMEVMKTAPATGACADLSGISFKVKDQPSAIVSYFDEGSIPTAIEGATATGASGLVTFSNVTGSLIEVEATKPGCTVTTVSRLQSGRINLAPQHITTMIGRIGN